MVLRTNAIACLAALCMACQLTFQAQAADLTTVITVISNATSVEIQGALNRLPESGGEVILPAGTFQVLQPIVLQRDHETLRGSGVKTILHLANGTNCPVIILGEPINDPKKTIQDLRVSDLFIDGNRSHQQRELWKLHGEGSEIRNNGITVQDVSNSIVENVTTAHCRSGGLVTTRNVRGLTVRNLNSFDNEFDGLACYQTENCVFAKLNLHDNPGAGISLDLDFDNNVISNATLNANDLGIFMRSSSENHFYNIAIHGSHHYGVFMAHAETVTKNGIEPAPRSECTHNSFANLLAADCGSAGFRVNNTTCTNNILAGAQFRNNVQGGLSMACADLVILR